MGDIYIYKGEQGFIWFRFPKIMGLRTPDVDTLLLNNWEAGVEFRGVGLPQNRLNVHLIPANCAQGASRSSVFEPAADPARRTASIQTQASRILIGIFFVRKFLGLNVIRHWQVTTLEPLPEKPRRSCQQSSDAR